MSDHDKNLRAWAKRRERIIALRGKGLSYAKIGEKMSPKVSKQAVAQVLKRAGVK